MKFELKEVKTTISYKQQIDYVTYHFLKYIFVITPFLAFKQQIFLVHDSCQSPLNHVIFIMAFEPHTTKIQKKEEKWPITNSKYNNQLL